MTRVRVLPAGRRHREPLSLDAEPKGQPIRHEQLLRVRLVTALLASLLVSGCGGSGQGDAAKVKQTVRHVLSALADGDGGTVCSLATASGQAKLARAVPGASCERVVDLVSRRLSAQMKEGLHSAQVKKVRISGDTATVQDADITSTRGTLSGFLKPGSGPTVLKRQSDGTWKVSG
jgi:hypothetical protein